jgi:hypothetical protein
VNAGNLVIRPQAAHFGEVVGRECAVVRRIGGPKSGIVTHEGQAPWFLVRIAQKM